MFAEVLEDPGHFVVLESWSDQEAIERHYRSPAFADYQRAIARLLVRESEYRMHVVQDTLHPLQSAGSSPTRTTDPTPAGRAARPRRRARPGASVARRPRAADRLALGEPVFPAQLRVLLAPALLLGLRSSGGTWAGRP